MNKLKKLLSVFLAVIMIMSCVPVVAFAATELTNRNVEIVVPTVTPKEITYGQNLGEVTVSGGEMWYNGTQIPGYFTVSSTTIVPAVSEAYEVMFKFVPTDSNYSCRSTFRKANTTFTGTWPTIKISAQETVAESVLAEAPVVTLPIDGGELLTKVSLSGGKVVDVDGKDITASGKWAWVEQSAVVTESATYTAKWTATNNDYESVTADVFVTVKTATCFVDEAGNVITPAIRIPFNSSITSDYLKQYIEKFTANCGKFFIGMIPTIDTSELGEYEYSVRIVPDSDYYTIEMLTFKVIIEPKEISPTISVYANDEYAISVGGEYTINPKGTFDFYVNDEIAVEGINYGKRFTWCPEKSGTYVLKAVYNPVENDTYKVNEAVLEDFELKLTWEINCINCRANDYKYGEKAQVVHDLGTQFAGWVFYDENGNEFTPENMEEYSSYVTFTMPDFSPTVKAKIIGEADDSGNDGNNSGSGNSGSTSIFGRFIEFLRNLFEKYINIFKTIFGMLAPAN